MMLICACALEKQVIKSYTIRTWAVPYQIEIQGAEDDEKKVRRFQSEIGYAQPLDWAVKGRRSLLQSKFNAGIVELWTACRWQGSKTMDKVAVVIPNYNGYRYLETCFAALAKQTFTEFTTYFCG